MIFQHVLVGVDGSPEGFVALAQARRLLPEGGELVAAVVCPEHLAVHIGLEAPRIAAELHAEAEAAAAKARRELDGVPGARVELVHGRPTHALLELARHSATTLVAVGSHSHRRAAGILLGSVATAMLHEAPASVLIARESERFPERIVVGTDGSDPANAAVETARALAERCHSALRLVAAEGGHAHRVQAGDAERDPRPPVDALVAAGEAADLVVVGSRGLHGVAALGSVSERVAHRANCSVLVVRTAAAGAAAQTHEAARA